MGVGVSEWMLIIPDRISAKSRWKQMWGKVSMTRSDAFGHSNGRGELTLMWSTSVGSIEGGLSTFHMGLSGSPLSWAISSFQLATP